MKDKVLSASKLAFSIEEAAVLVGLGRNTTYELCRAGRIQTIRVGRRWIVPRASLENFLSIETGSGEPTQAA